jgi:hypothetical protein
LIPRASQCATNSRDCRDQQIYFSGFYSPHVAGIDVNQFSQPLLSDGKGGANASNVAAEFPKISQEFCFGHATLPETLEVDLKAVLRPNSGERKSVVKWSAKYPDMKKLAFLFFMVVAVTPAFGFGVSVSDPANWITNTVAVPPGWSLTANPYHHNRGTTVLDAVPDNSVGELFKGVP